MYTFSPFCALPLKGKKEKRNLLALFFPYSLIPACEAGRSLGANEKEKVYVRSRTAGTGRGAFKTPPRWLWKAMIKKNPAKCPWQ